MKWLFDKGKWNDDGSFTIEPNWAQRWKVQMETLYQNLPESMKDSDREEAVKILGIYK